MTRQTLVLAPTICPICFKDPKGRPVFNVARYANLTQKANWKLCYVDQTLNEEGFIALVETETVPAPGSLLDAAGAKRTGKVIHVKRAVADMLFKAEIDPKWSMVFCEPNIMIQIEEMVRLLK